MTRGTQPDTTRRNSLTPIRKSAVNTHVCTHMHRVRRQRNWSSSTLLVGMLKVSWLWKTVSWLPKKIRHFINWMCFNDAALGTQQVYPWALKAALQRDSYTPAFVATFFVCTKPRRQEQQRCPSTGERIH